VTGLLLPAGVAVVGVLAAGVYHPNAPLFGRAIGRGPRDGRSLYLTFDDGPNPETTDGILDTLEASRVPAAFFMVGDHVRRFATAARRAAGLGHLIGNHTQHHVKLHVRGPARVRSELQEAHDTIATVTGQQPRVFRAPHGYRNPFVGFAARRLGYQVIGWTFGVWDSDRPPAVEIRSRVRAKLRPGAIILLHDGDGSNPYGDRRPTAEALPGVIEDARAAGYEFRSLGELLA